MGTSRIIRLRGTAAGRSRATIGHGLVFAVATGTPSGTTVAEQTRTALAALDTNLADAGSGRDRLLSVTIYLADIRAKTELDEEWSAWIGPEGNWPQRACVQAALPINTLVEVTAIAMLTENNTSHEGD